MPTLGVFHTGQVGSRKGTAWRTAEQPVFMGCLLSLTVPVGPFQLGSRLGIVKHMGISLNQHNLNSNSTSAVHGCQHSSVPPSTILRENGQVWGEAKREPEAANYGSRPVSLVGPLIRT